MEWVIPVVVALVLLALVSIFLFRVRARGKERARLLATGIEAPAEILTFSDVGSSGEDSVMEFLLEVHPDDHEAFKFRVRHAVSRLAVHKLKRGKILRVKYDPATKHATVVPGQMFY